MWKYVLVGGLSFAAGIFVAKMAYENKVRGGIGDVLSGIGDKIGINLRGGFVESIADKFAGV